MKKIFLGLFLIFGLAIGFLNLDFKAGEPTGTTQVEYTYVLNLNGSQGTPVNLTTNYGTSVSFDRGTQENYEFVGYINQGKLISTLDQAISIRVTENTYVQYYFKPAGEVAVIFMDTNLNFQTIRYTDNDGETPTNKMVYNETYPLPLYTNFSKPGLSSTGWTSDGLTAIDFSTATFTSDTIVYPLYSTAVNNLTLSITDGTASVTGPYTFNQVLTVTANGTGTFKYWLKDGRIASLDETYTFTIAKAHELEAVYDTDFVANTGSFVGISDVYDNLRSGYYTVIGNIDLATGEELVEWGIITSDLPGGITLDTPGIVKYNSNKLNSGTNEFVMSFAKGSKVPNYRAFVTTINGTTVKTTYSYYQENNLAIDLIISEYIEGSSNNKVVELYNGTGAAIDLKDYSVLLYTNGATSPTNTQTFTESIILNHGDTYRLWNSSATASFKVSPGMPSSIANFNGDDSIELKKGTSVIDSFGQVGVDPGTAWNSNSVSTENMTLVRKANILSGRTNSTSAFDPSVEWMQYPIDTASNLGFHTVNIFTKITTPTTVTLTGDSSTTIGTSKTLGMTYSISSVQGVFWVSSNPSVLSVNKDTGEITGIAEGTATITAYSYYDHSIMDTQEINVVPANTTYTITYYLDGGTNHSNNPESFVAGDLPITLGLPTKENYIFDGWYTESSYTNKVSQLTSSQNYNLYAKWLEILPISTAKQLPDASTVSAVVGIVTGINGGSVYINDGTAAMVAYNQTFAASAAVGNKYLFTNGVIDIYYGVIEIINFTPTILETNVTLPSALDLNSISEVLNSMQSERVNLSNLTFVSYIDKNMTVTDGTNEIVVKTNQATGAIVDKLQEGFAGRALDIMGMHVGIYNNAPQLYILSVDELVFAEITDAQAINLDADLLPDSLELIDNYVVPIPEYGSTYTVTAVSTELQANIDYTTTPGTLLVTRPTAGNPDLVGTITIQVTLGTEDPIDVVINVIVKAEITQGNLVETLLYFTGFENSTTKASYALGTITSDSLVWTIAEGLRGNTVSDWPIDTYSIRLRASSSLPVYASIDSSFSDMSRISFYYARYGTETGALLSVQVSNDNGQTWKTLLDSSPGPSAMTLVNLTLDYNILGFNEGDSINVKFLITGTSGKRLVLDNVSIYGLRPES